MASYKLTSKLTAGVYDSQQFNHQAALGPLATEGLDVLRALRLQPYLYAKAEEHVIHGTAIGYDTDLIPMVTTRKREREREREREKKNNKNTKLAILKVGVSFSQESHPWKLILSSLFAVTASMLAASAGAQVIVIADDSVKASAVSKDDLKDVSPETPLRSKTEARWCPYCLKTDQRTRSFSRPTWQGRHRLPGGGRSLVFSGQASMPKSLDDDAAAVVFVAHNPGTIGYIDKASPHDGVRVLAVN